MYQHSAAALAASAFKLSAFASAPLVGWAPVAAPKSGDLSDAYAPNMNAVLCRQARARAPPKRAPPP